MSLFGTGNTLQAAPPAAIAPAALAFAGFWRRTGAYLIDVIIMMVANSVVLGAFGLNMMTAQLDPNDLPVGMIVTSTLASMIIPALYVIGFWVYAGATPGKMALGLRVLRAEDGGPITVGQAIGRFFAYMVSSFVFMLGFLWIAFDGRKQGWHDKLASTVVVKKAALVPTFRA